MFEACHINESPSICIVMQRRRPFDASRLHPPPPENVPGGWRGWWAALVAHFGAKWVAGDAFDDGEGSSDDGAVMGCSRGWFLGVVGGSPWPFGVRALTWTRENGWLSNVKVCVVEVLKLFCDWSWWSGGLGGFWLDGYCCIIWSLYEIETSHFFEWSGELVSFEKSLLNGIDIIVYMMLLLLFVWNQDHKFGFFNITVIRRMCEFWKKIWLNCEFFVVEIYSLIVYVYYTTRYTLYSLYEIEVFLVWPIV